MRARQNIYEIPVTIGDERVLTVRARTPAEAKQKAREGKYLRLGKSLSRGFLTVGTPAPVERPRA